MSFNNMLCIFVPLYIIHASLSLYIYIYIYIYIYVSIYMYIHIYIYIHMSAFTLTCCLTLRTICMHKLCFLSQYIFLIMRVCISHLAPLR